MNCRSIALVVVVMLSGSIIWFENYDGRQNDLKPPPLREDLVKQGMSAGQVEDLLGKPERVVSEPENGLVGWTYYEREENLMPGAQLGGLTVLFKSNVVYKVSPIFVYSYHY